jgi:hypothetical protein
LSLPARYPFRALGAGSIRTRVAPVVDIDLIAIDDERTSMVHGGVQSCHALTLPDPY